MSGALAKGLASGLITLGSSLNENYQRRKTFEHQASESEKNREFQIEMQKEAWKREDALNRAQRERENTTTEAFREVVGIQKPDMANADYANEAIAMGAKIDQDGNPMVANLIGDVGEEVGSLYEQQLGEYLGIRNMVRGQEVLDPSAVEAKVTEKLKDKGDEATRQRLIENLQKESKERIDAILEDAELKQKHNQFIAKLESDKELQSQRDRAALGRTAVAGIFNVAAAQQKGEQKGLDVAGGHIINSLNKEREEIETATATGGGLLAGSYKAGVGSTMKGYSTKILQDPLWDSLVKNKTITPEGIEAVSKLQTDGFKFGKKGATDLGTALKIYYDAKIKEQANIAGGIGAGGSSYSGMMSGQDFQDVMQMGGAIAQQAFRDAGYGSINRSNTPTPKPQSFTEKPKNNSPEAYISAYKTALENDPSEASRLKAIINQNKNHFTTEQLNQVNK